MSIDVAFRPGTPADGPALRRLHERSIRMLGRSAYSQAECDSWADGLIEERYGEAMGAGEVFDLATAPDGAILGFCSRQKREVLGFFVDPDFAGQGIGTQLIERAEAAIAAQGFPKIVLGAALSAVSFYERRGYRIDERRLWTTRGGLPLEVAWMSKSLIRPRDAGVEPRPPLLLLRESGRACLAQALEGIEGYLADPPLLALLDAAWLDQRGRSIGLTLARAGHGRAFLTSVIKSLRKRKLSVAIVADAAECGEELLAAASADESLFLLASPVADWEESLVRRLAPSMLLLRAIYDVTFIVGGLAPDSQSALDVLSDRTALVLPPLSTDALALLHQSLTRPPDMVVVEGAGSAAVAEETLTGLRDLRSASNGDRPFLLLSVDTTDPQSIEGLLDALAERTPEDAERRHDQGTEWVIRTIRHEHGRMGVSTLASDYRRRLEDRANPFRRIADVLGALRREN